MSAPYRVPWSRLWDYLAALGRARDREELFRIALDELPRLIPYDVAFACFVDPPADGPLPRVSAVTADFPERPLRLYLERYFAIDTAYLRSRRGDRYMEQNWSIRSLDRDEFTVDFMRGLLGIGMTAGLPIGAGCPPPAMVFGFGRTGSATPKDLERRILELIRPHIENYFAIMNRIPEISAEDYCAAELAEGSRLLSRREAEVASLLCKRYRPAEIASRLLVSPRTVERHVEHIYQKLGVRCRRELLGKLLGRAPPPALRAENRRHTLLSWPPGKSASAP
jgi:DNA-binding CsgD family transcriptional regulator